MRTRAVGALAGDGDVEESTAGHHEPGADGELPTATPGRLCMP